MRRKTSNTYLYSRVLLTCMLTTLFAHAFVPSVAATGEPVSVEYNFYSCLAVNESIRPLTDYDEGKNTNWKFKQHFNETSDVKRYSSVPTLRMTSSSKIGWTAFIIKTPKAGVYQASMTYERHSGSKTTEVYLLPADSDLTDVSALLAEKTPVGLINYKYSVDIGYDRQTVILGEIELSGAEEYMLLMRSIERNPEPDSAGGGTMHMSTFLLQDAESARLKTATYCVETDTISVEHTIESFVAAYLGDGSPVNLSNSEYVTTGFESSNPAIASVDSKTGRITGISPGDAEITFTVTLGTVSLSESVTITVLAPLTYPGAESTVLFNFTEGLERSGESILPLTEYNSNKNKNWAYYAAYVADIKAQSYYNTLRIYGGGLDGWIAFKLDVPTAGRYIANVGYLLHYGCIAANVYILPSSILPEYIPTLLEVKQPIGVINFLTNTVVDSTYLGVVDIPVSGDYIMVMQVKEVPPTTPGGAGFGGMHISTLTLDGVLPERIESAELSLDENAILLGDTTSADFSCISEGGTPTNLANATVTYKSLSPSIAAVDKNGVITGVSAGTATIQVDVSLYGITVSDTATITVTAAGTPMTTGRLSINADNISGNGAGAINTGDSGYDGFGTSAEYSVGSSVTLTAAPIYEGKQFMYWKNSASNRIVSGDNQYTFKIGSNTSVTAIYRDTEKGYLVEFFDRNGRVLLTDHLDDIKTSVIAPLPYSAGYEFLNWQSGNVFVNAGETVTASTVGGQQALFTAQYDNEAKTYTVVVNDGVNTTSNSYTYNTEVTVTPGDLPAGQKFAYWTRGGEIVSYETEYSFYVWDDTAITAVSCAATDSITKVPSIAMDTIKVVPDGEGYRVLFLAERTVPSDYTLIESGILISTSVSEPTLESSNTYKAIAQPVSPNGQFSARKDEVAAGATCYARAYMIYKTPGNDYEVIYSNTVNETV